MQFKSGAVIGFSARDVISDTINLFTWGIPGFSIHHVGIVCVVDGVPLLYESTTSTRSPCCRTGARVKGTQAHPLDEIVRTIDAKLWHYPLRRPLYDDEDNRLFAYLESTLGLPYDLNGAIGSGGTSFRLIESILHGENLASLFCSEWVAAAHINVGVLQTRNASKWNPNRLCRHEVYHGICNPPVRFK